MSSLLNKFFSLLLFLCLISYCFAQEDIVKKITIGQKNKLNGKDILSTLSILASDDDELKAKTITELAKTGDTRLEEFFELYRQEVYTIGPRMMGVFELWSILRLKWMMISMNLLP